MRIVNGTVDTEALKARAGGYNGKQLDLRCVVEVGRQVGQSFRPLRNGKLCIRVHNAPIRLDCEGGEIWRVDD